MLLWALPLGAHKSYYPTHPDRALALRASGRRADSIPLSKVALGRAMRLKALVGATLPHAA